MGRVATSVRCGRWVSLTRRAVAVGLCAGLLAGCAWRRVEPHPEARAAERRPVVVGLAAADEGTSLSDLQAIARTWSELRAFDRVQFPFREGDRVDLVVELRLRQRAETHGAANLGSAAVLGLTLGLLGPVVGLRITEVHDVAVRCTANRGTTAPRTFSVSTDAVFGIGADPQAMAKDLDDAQRERIASAVLDTLADLCGLPAQARPGPAP